MKRCVILLVAVQICLALIPYALAEEQKQFESGDYLFTVQNTQDGTASVCISYYSGQEQNLQIPETMGEYPIRGIGEEAFMKNQTLQSVQIPGCVEYISSGAFAQCPKLTDVTLNDGLLEIGDYAFNRCPSLESLMLPDSVAALGRGAFSFSSSLASVEIGFGLQQTIDNPFTGCKALSSIVVPEENSLFSVQGDMMFYQPEKKLIACMPGKEAVERMIPEGTQIIGNDACSYCDSIQTVLIPQSVNEIGWGAFGYCPNLNSISLPDLLRELSSGLFSGCSSLEQIAIPKGVTNLGHAVFYDCGNLKEVILPGGLQEIGDYAFSNCASLQSLQIPSGVNMIGEYAFMGAPLTAGVFPGSYAEEWCIQNAVPYSSLGPVD